MYGSNFCIETFRPMLSRSIAMLEQVRPLPSELTTPPVTKMCLVTVSPHCSGVLVGACERISQTSDFRQLTSERSDQFEVRSLESESECLLLTRATKAA